MPSKIYICRVFNSLYNTYPSLIHANGPAKDILPWIEEVRARCEKGNDDFRLPLPSQTISSNYLIRKAADVSQFGPNPNEDIMMREQDCEKSFRSVKQRMKFCFKHT